MRKITMYLLAAALMLTGCDKEQEPAPPTIERECTVMLYGCGGGNLDDYLIENLRQCYSVGTNQQLGMSCLVKFSKSYKKEHDLGQFTGAVRFLIPEATDTSDFNLFEKEAERIGGDDYPLYDADNLSEFVKWSAQQLPAKNYILILWNHGGGWSPLEDAPQTRAIIYDDNVSSTPLSHASLIEALQKSGVHLRAIMTDACMMALLETYSDYAKVADYAVGAVEPSPNLGIRYDWLLPSLKNCEFDAIFEYNLKKFTDRLCAYWDEYCPLDPQRDENEEITDFGFVNLRKLPALNEVVAKATSEMITTWDMYKETYQSAALQTPPIYGGRDFVDAQVFIEKAAELSGNAEMQKICDDFEKVFNNCAYRVLVHPAYEQKPWRKISIGVCLPKDYILYKGAYDLLTFSKQTGWGNLLEGYITKPID